MHGLCTSKLFHLAVPPNLYEPVFRNIADSGLSTPCDEHQEGSWTRILVEKPFGSDREGAVKLDALLGELFQENQIFRIDHYLAKESLQNLLSFRFSNAIFEPIWNSESIERVDIRLFENFGIEKRGNSYDGVGALRDMGQSHLLQILALIAMEDPEKLETGAIRKARANVLRNIIPGSKDIHDYAQRAQYEDYKGSEGVENDSDTETYFKLKVNVDTPRWKNTPFYLENGKAMNDIFTEVIITFKSTQRFTENTYEKVNEFLSSVLGNISNSCNL